MFCFQYVYEALSKHNFDMNNAMKELSNKEKPLKIMDFETFKQIEEEQPKSNLINVHSMKRKEMSTPFYTKPIKGEFCFIFIQAVNFFFADSKKT